MAKKEIKNPAGFALGKENYKLMAIGFAIIVVGFILMAGGGSDDPNVFNPDIFSFRRITLAPIILLFGFAFEIFAIMKKPKSNNQP
jgi:membrane-bound ClpP family serine protease